MTAAPASEQPIITFWSDIGCPWATLALHTLHAAADARGQELLIDHRAFPLELFNSQPTPKLIVDAEVVMLGAHRPELGWRLWAGHEWEYPSSILPALEAVQAAKAPEVGGLHGSDQLDTALRRAFYVDHRCISIHSVILDIAEGCAHVDAKALEAALARGAGRREVYEQWHQAQGPEIQGSPHLFAPGGWAVHNPGAHYTYNGSPETGGFPRLDRYDAGWADELLDSLARQAG
ncbi:DsbA family oxidoreductase [Streptomyces purpureus]|uniref:DsbA family oxidoreductase n=1 Tax=Streptomyces purpureus TaxID=1951 RepID=UPI00035EE3CE|nr:DsbA family protein [Streptomyces purpureus]